MKQKKIKDFVYYEYDNQWGHSHFDIIWAPLPHDHVIADMHTPLPLPKGVPSFKGDLCVDFLNVLMFKGHRKVRFKK